MSLIGNYETATVYYQGVIQQIHRLLATIEDPGRKLKWQQIQGEVAQEYDVVKNIVQTLALFKGKIRAFWLFYLIVALANQFCYYYLRGP